MKKLYGVKTVVDKFPRGNGYYNNVSIAWFAIEREKPAVPYKRGIENYKPGNLYAKDALKELFTFKEVLQLIQYISNFPFKKIEIKEIALPLPHNCAGYGSFAVGGEDDFYCLSETEGYPLPFKVWGYVNFQDAEYTPNKKLERNQLEI
ncbi:MAG: hypothetical protein QMD44_03245 [Thermodesulfovibrionales bacterium]|jgi:hypothetical protein|nr:hypothetical protein [Thermodesulfovibrionales bacterium]